MVKANRITELLKIDFPIIQAPMLVATTPAMISEASDCGCLGSMPLGYASKESARLQIQEIKTRTNKPFAVNVFPFESIQLKKGADDATLRSYFSKYDIPYFDSIPKENPFDSYKDIIDIAIEEGISVISFHFGIPAEEVISKLKQQNIITMATATCVQEAKWIEAAGIDIIVAQGNEAGGNHGTFIEGPLPQIGLFALLPQIVDAVSIPVIAAGGIMDGRTAKAALTLGASGVQIGSALLLAKESGITPSWKKAITQSTDTSTILTNVWSGRYGRCIQNEFTKAMKEHKVYPSPIQHYLTSKLRAYGREKDILDIQSLWAGQSAHYAEEKSTREILQNISKSFQL